MSIATDKQRLLLEHAAMRERWGESPKWCCDASRTWFWWDYTVHLEGNELPIRIVYPEDYPASPPEIIIQAKLPEGTPHVIYNKVAPLPGPRMCWHYPGESRHKRNVWNPATDTAALAVGVAHRWFLAFLVWLSTAKWPVPDAIR